MVAQGPLEAFVMVRIHVGQPLLPREIENPDFSRTNSAKKPAESEAGNEQPVRFPKTIRFRKAECKIYGKKPDYPFYRVAWYAAGHRRVKQFATYSEAKQFADATVKDLAEGSHATALTPKQAVDAIAVFEQLSQSNMVRSNGNQIN